MSLNCVADTPLAGPRFKSPPRPVWLTNGDVAWEIGDRRVALNYYYGIYGAPKGWHIITGSLWGDWFTGLCGEERRICSGDN